MLINNKQLKDFLEDSDLVKKQELKKAWKKSEKTKQKLSEILLKQKLISQEDLTKLYAYISGIPFISLEKAIIDPEILRIIPEPIAKNHNIISYKKNKGSLEVAMLDPADLEMIEFIKKKSGLKILPRLTNKTSIDYCLKQYQKSLKAELGKFTKQGIKIVKDSSPKGIDSDKELEKAAKDLPIIQIVDTLLKHAILDGASDIHIEPEEKEVLVRYRVDGILQDAMTLPKQVLTGIIARIKILSNLKLDEHRLPQDGRFKIETKDYKVSFRVSVLPTMEGEKIVMRLLSEDSKGLTLEKLGLHDDSLEKIHRNIKKPNGMLLVTGPTGSGKTTTLYTILDILNTREVNINTIEDPIEYRMTRVNQTQVNPKINLTFARGLRALLRQDPDIIMVGEIRDNETADIAVNAALTGHLVLSTLHTNDAVGTLPRLIDMKVKPFLIASTCNVIIAQRLVRKLCMEKKSEKYKLNQKEINSLNKDFDLEKILLVLKAKKIIKQDQTWQTVEFTKPHEKCTKCHDGYKGRVGIYEVLEITDEIRALITKGASIDDMQAKAIALGMTTLVEDGFIKAVQGMTTIDEVLRVSKE